MLFKNLLAFLIIMILKLSTLLPALAVFSDVYDSYKTDNIMNNII